MLSQQQITANFSLDKIEKNIYAGKCLFVEKTTINITHIFLKQDQDVYAKDVCESKLSD